MRPQPPKRTPGAPRARSAVATGVALGLLALSLAGPAWGQGGIEEQSRALQRAHEAVLGLQVRAVEDGRTLATLGRERSGSGVLISERGLVLTAAFLLLEAEHAELQTHDGRLVPARVVAVDQATGLGLLQALAPLGLAPVTIAPASAASRLRTDEPVLMAIGAPQAGGGETLMARWAGRKPYAATWEFQLDEALFTTPARQDHAGAALFNLDGQLLGIGALVVPDARQEALPEPTRETPSGPAAVAARLPAPGNLFVPASLLPPLLPELLASGRSKASQRAWLGLNCLEVEDGVLVMQVTEDSPADVAGLRAGDRILALDGHRVADLRSLWRRLWASDQPARPVTLEIRREGERQQVTVHAVDRAWALRRPEGV